MAPDQMSIHISRKPGAGSTWGVETLRFASALGRHSLFPEGRSLHEVLSPGFAEALLEAVCDLDQERRMLNRPDFAFVEDGVSLQGMFCHLDQMADGLLRVTIRIGSVLGRALRLLRDRDMDLAAAQAPAPLPRADVAALTALERVLLPLMNATEALQQRLATLPVDPRLGLLLANVREGCGEARLLTRDVLDRASDGPDGPAAGPAGAPARGARGAPRVLPALLEAWAREADVCAGADAPR